MAELMGRESGLCRGLGGSMHLVDTEHGFMGATGVVGRNLPLALGTALTQHLKGTDQVTVVFFGDGAVQAGHFSESINLAALWELPLMFVCEKTAWPSSPRARTTRRSSVSATWSLRTGLSARRSTGAMYPPCTTRSDGF